MPNLNLSGWLAIALAAVAAAWGIDHWMLSAEVDAAQRQRTAFEQTLATERAGRLQQLRTIEGDHARAVATLSDQLHQAEATNAKLKTDRDAAIAAGARRVYVRATCPDLRGVPADPPAAGGSDAAAPELDPAYRPTLSDLRSGADTCRNQVIALQAYANEVQATLARAAKPLP